MQASRVKNTCTQDARVDDLPYIYRQEKKQTISKREQVKGRKYPYCCYKAKEIISLNKNTLYITFDGLSDPLGQSQILPYLIGIAKQGYHITILSCEKNEALNAEKQNIEALIKELTISWVYINYETTGGFLSRYSYINKLEKIAKKIISEKSISLIHCRSYLSALIGLRFKLKYQIPFLFDMRGYWADERIDGAIWTKKNPLHKLFYNFFKAKEKQFFKHADAIVMLTQASLNDVDERFKEIGVKSKSVVIPCCTNTQRFNLERTLKPISIKGISDTDFLLIYTGSIGTWYFTKEMIDCVLEWKLQIPNIKLLILTKDKNELNTILNEYTAEQKQIIFSASAAYNDVPNYLALAKAAIFFIKPAYSKIASSPTKMAECWAMNLPIITNAGIGDNDIYFGQHQGGILIHQFTQEAYQQACTQFLQLQGKQINYRKIALDFFDTQMAISKYLAVYHQLQGK